MDTRRTLVILVCASACGGASQTGGVWGTDWASSGLDPGTGLEASDGTGEAPQPDPDPDGPSPSPPCSVAVQGAWVQEADLPFALNGDAATVLRVEDGLRVLGASDCEAEGLGASPRVLLWEGPGSAWAEEPELPVAARFDGVLSMTGGRMLLVTDDEPRLVLRSTQNGSWESLGEFPTAGVRSIALAQMGDGVLAAYVGESGEVFRSDDEGETWQALAEGPISFWHRQALRIEPIGPATLLVTGPEVLHTYDIDTGSTEPSSFWWNRPASATVGWSDGRRFGLLLADCCSGEDWEITPYQPLGVLVDGRQDLEDVEYACRPPIVLEVADLRSRLLSNGEAFVAMHVQNPNEGRRNWFDMYEEDSGWSRTPAAPIDLPSANLTMLTDGSILALGGAAAEGDQGCSQEVWRWVP